MRKQDAMRTDWNSVDVVLGARAGTTAEIAAAEQFPLAKVAAFDNDAAMFGALDGGQVNGRACVCAAATDSHGDQARHRRCRGGR